MAKGTLHKAVTCTVGAKRGEGITELIGPGMIYVTGDTTVEPGTELRVGYKVLVDYRLEPRTFGENHGMLALKVRPYGPAPSDVIELQGLIERLTRAGLVDPGFGEPKAFMEKLFRDRMTRGDRGPVSLEQELVRLLEARDMRFPMNTWQHDIEPAVCDMEEKLRVIGVTAELPRAPIQAVFERHLNEADDQVGRRHFLAEIAREANEALERSGLALRWYQFKDLPWEDEEPFWLLVTPDQKEGLLREQVFRTPPD